MNRVSFRILLYDCVKDILLISKPVWLCDDDDDDERVRKSAIFVLWLILNHR